MSGQTIQSLNLPPVASGGCSVWSGSRAALLALRNSNSLVVGCKYKVTDYNRGALGAAEITLTATDVNVLSNGVHVKTAFDTSAWIGFYRIETHRLFGLLDNRGNAVSGQAGDEVDRFPWGQASVYQNTVRNAPFYADANTTQLIRRNTITDWGYVDLRGFRGAWEMNQVNTNGRVDLRNATQVDMRRTDVNTYAYVYGVNEDDIYIQRSKLSNNTLVRKYGGSGRLTLLDVNARKGDIRQYDGTLYINIADLAANARLYQRGKNLLDVRNYTGESNSLFESYHQGDDFIRLWNGGLSELAEVRIRNSVTAGAIYAYYWEIGSRGLIDIRNSSKQLNLQDLQMSSRGYLYINGNTGSGQLLIQQCSIRDRGEMRLINISGNHIVRRSHCDGYLARLYLNGTTAATIDALSVDSNGRVQSNGGNCRINSVKVMSVGHLVLNNPTGYINQSTILSYGYLTMVGASIAYRSFVANYARINTNGFNFLYCFVANSMARTLTANNSNRYEFAGTQGLV